MPANAIPTSGLLQAAAYVSIWSNMSTDCLYCIFILYIYCIQILHIVQTDKITTIFFDILEKQFWT